MKKIKRMTKKRMVLVLGLASLVFLGLIARTGYIQIINGEWLSTEAIEQQTREVPIPAKRGTIYDRNMTEIAVSVTKYTVWCKPVEVKDVEKTSKTISEILDMEYEEIYKSINKKKMALVEVERWIDDDKAQQITQQKLPGIWVAEDNQRYYPYENFAAYVLGHTSNDGQGIVGIEKEYNEELTGIDGKLIVSTDASGKEIPQGLEKYYEPEQGKGIVLTIDEVIQHYLENAAQKAYEINNALRVTLVAVDPKTMDVLGMTSKPDYDPNNSRTAIYPYYEEILDSYEDDEIINGYYKMWRNPAISDTYEPGSTFKLITSAASLEENVIKENEKFTCKGTVTVGGRVLKCWRSHNPHGEQTFAQGVQNSCNPVFVEVSSRLGVSTFHDYIESFGLTSKTGIDLPGEANSIVYNEKNIGPVELATMSFGQSIAITPMQLITAISSIANDGKLMEANLVKAITDNQGNIIEEIEPKVIRQVISEETSEEMMKIAESVVSEGSGNIAYIPGYRIGGKTGTAQKVIDGVYAQGKYICSFVGIAPTDDPKIAVLAIVDEPTGVQAFGSTTAGPIVKEVMQEALPYLGVEQVYTEEEKENLTKSKVFIPDVTNLNIEDATKELEKADLKAVLDTDIEIPKGTKVIDMSPKPGAEVTSGSSIVLYFEKE